MTAKRRPRRRPFNGSPDDHAPTEQWFSRLRTDVEDGATYDWGGANDIGVMPAPADRAPAAILPMPQARAVMKVYPPGPGVPGPTPQALEVVRYLRNRVAILRRRGQLDRISDEKLAMLPAMSRRATARVIVDEAAELLRCGGAS